jgi:hypothetical protein
MMIDSCLFEMAFLLVKLIRSEFKGKRVPRSGLRVAGAEGKTFRQDQQDEQDRDKTCQTPGPDLTGRARAGCKPVKRRSCGLNV